MKLQKRKNPTPDEEQDLYDIDMPTGVIGICNALFSASGYDIAMVNAVVDRFVSLMPMEDFLLILAKSERSKGN